MVVAYSPAKISVKSVFENLHLGRGSMVSFSDDPASGMLTIDRSTGSPAQRGPRWSKLRTVWLRLDWRRATPADFTVQTLAVYDANGAPSSGSVSKLPVRDAGQPLRSL
jgi:hypothetical protein